MCSRRSRVRPLSLSVVISVPAISTVPPSPQGQNHHFAPQSQIPTPVVVAPVVAPSAPPSAMMPETVSLKEIARNAALRAEREAISGMLARTNWNKRKAAARLQIGKAVSALAAAHDRA